MRWKQAFIRTMKETPKDAEVISHILMSRSGMMRKVGSGIYEYLPLGWKVIRSDGAWVGLRVAACGSQVAGMNTQVWYAAVQIRLAEHCRLSDSS